MRKLIISPCFLLVCLTIFYACRKENSQDSLNKEIVDKVNVWLDNQKSSIQSKKNSIIEILKNNLDFSGLSFEQLDEEKRFLIVPIKEDFKFTHRLDKSLINNLVLTLNKSGSVIKGNVVLYTPESKLATKKVSKNTFSNIFNYKTLDCNGQFRFSSITGSFLYQLKFKNGELNSVGKMRQGSAPNASSREMTCIDWYLITTYYEDGVVVDETKEYLYTSCDGECSDPHTLCRNPDDGGGSTPPEDEYEYATVKTVYWTVTQNTSEDPITWMVKSYENIKGFYSVPNGSGHFVSADHTISSLDNAAESYASWTETSGSAKLEDCYPSGCQTVMCTVTGTLSFPTLGRQPITITKTQGWSPSMVRNF
jgi:hypothetical protein